MVKTINQTVSMIHTHAEYNILPDDVKKCKLDLTNEFILFKNCVVSSNPIIEFKLFIEYSMLSYCDWCEDDKEFIFEHMEALRESDPYPSVKILSQDMLRNNINVLWVIFISIVNNFYSKYEALEVEEWDIHPNCINVIIKTL